jgi:hypothetical protein
MNTVNKEEWPSLKTKSEREMEGVPKEHICVPLLCALLAEVEAWPLEIGPPLITQRNLRQALCRLE